MTSIRNTLPFEEDDWDQSVDFGIVDYGQLNEQQSDDPSTKSSDTQNEMNSQTAVRSSRIQVRCIAHLSSASVLEHYFRNERRSRGGSICDFKFDPKHDIAVIEFEDTKTAENVLCKLDLDGKKERSHVLENKALLVSRLPDVDNRSVYIDNQLPSWVSLHHWEDWLGRHSRSDVEVIFREDQTGVLARFDVVIDIDSLKNALVKHPYIEGEEQFSGKDLRLIPVPHPDAIILYGDIPSCDSVILSIENHLTNFVPLVRSSEVRHIVHKQAEKMTLVVFEDFRTIGFLPKEVNINGVAFKWVPFYDYLGWVPLSSKANFFKKFAFCASTVQLTSLQVEFLTASATSAKYVEEKVKTKIVECHYMVDKEHSLLNVTSETKKSSEDVAQFILSLMSMIEITLDGPMAKVLDEKEIDFRNLTDQSKIATCFFYLKSESSLKMVAASAYADGLKRCVESFFEIHAVYETCFLADDPRRLYIKKYFDGEIKAKCYEVRAASVRSDDTGTITVQCTRSQRSQINEYLNEVLHSVEVFTEYLVSKPGMSNYFREGTGEMEIGRIQEKTKTLIKTQDELSKLNDGSMVKNGIIKLQGTLNNKLTISVVHGDITRQDVNAIVNAANINLKHDGGVAAAIVAAGGEEIQAECTEYVRRAGQLKEGQVFTSKSGKLKCKNVIHAVGPQWHGGNQQEAALLKTTILSIMDEANRKKMSAIAIPAISTKIFGFPVDLAVPIIVQAVASTCKADVPYTRFVRDVRFVDLHAETIKILVQEVDNCPGFRKESQISVPTASLLPWKYMDHENSGHPKVKQQVKPTSASVVSKNVLLVNGVAIELRKSDIVTTAKDCDAVVNSTSQDNLLSGGASAQAIQKAAGGQYVADIASRYPNGLQNLSVAKTSAGQLGCSHVYHICCGTWDPVVGESRIQDKVKACLEQAEQDKIAKIAFPAMGTGGLHYPLKLVAASMYKASIDYIVSNPNSTIKLIVFVIFTTDNRTKSAFKEELKSRKSSDLQQVNSTDPHPVASNVEEHAVQVGSVTVEVVNEDITKQKTDDVLCPSNKQLDLTKGEVAKTLAVAGGNALKMLADLGKHDFQDGVCMLATKKFLPFRRIVFIDSQSTTDGDLLLNALKEANHCASASIAIPAIGTGELNQNVGNTVDSMMRSIQMFASMTPNPTLKLVRIVIYKKDIYNAFWKQVSSVVKGLQEHCNEKSHKMIDFVIKKLRNNGSRKSAEIVCIPVEKPLTLYICGSKVDISKAQQELDKVCKDRCPSRTINNDIVGQLDDAAIETLKTVAQEFGVELKVSVPHNRITIKGFKAAECQEWLREVLDKYKEELAIPVKWFIREQTSNEWHPMTYGITVLEREFQKKTPHALIELDRHNMCEVDFESMTAKCMQAFKDVIIFLKRREPNDPIPDEWEWNGRGSRGSDDYNLVPLDHNSGEFKAARDAALRTVPTVQIEKIERVENVAKMKQFIAQKEKMECSLPQGTIIERNLFHGTKPENIPSICTSNFNRSMKTANAHMFGIGSYFARDFKYSTAYGKTIFYSFVLTGRYTQGETDITVAPMLDEAKGSRYDSVVNDVKDPSIFVVFSDNHAYPAYLITIK